MRLVPLLLSALLSLCAGDVGDFSRCLNFFYRARPPTGIAGTPICQRYSNRYHFATLYSRERRTPWFSGYVFSQPHGKRPKGQWKYEPQLANSKADGNMVPFPIPPAKVDQNVIESQAVQKDYTNSTYTRGHLNPSQHHNGTDVRRATFTLTNVVPQKAASNDGPWAKLEDRVSKILSEYCLGEAYIVTGVIPYEKDHWLKDEGRVAIPEYMWSAYCCQNYSQDLPKSLNDIFPTFGAIGRNDPNSTQEIVPVNPHIKKDIRGYDVRSMSLPILEGYLKEKYRMSISVFDQQCSRVMDENRTSCTSSPDYLTTYFDNDNCTGNYSNYSDFGIEMCEPEKRQELTIMAVQGTVFLIAFFLGLIGNSLVIATFAKYHRLRLRCMTDVFLFYLAIFNLLLLLTLPLELSETFNGSVKMWTRVAMITGFFVPCVAMLVCYSTIGRVLMQGRGKCFRRQKTLRLIVALILLFLLFQLPYAMVLSFRLFTSNYSCKMWSDIHLAEVITRSLVYAHCCFNPMLYALLGVRFRSDVMRLLHDCGCICSCLSHITPNLNYGSSISASSSSYKYDNALL